MKTHFAPAERASNETIQSDMEFVSSHPIVEALLNTTGSLLAVLNENRQILLLNDVFLRTIGVKDSGTVLGLRPGEAINCVHSGRTSGGCGTTPFCVTCGAAIAIVTSMSEDRPVEKDCFAVVEQNSRKSDLYLRVRSCPMDLEGRRYIFLLIQNMTVHQRRAELERAFFHDISNIVMGLEGATTLLQGDDPAVAPERVERIKQLSQRLSKEIMLQKTLVQSGMDRYMPIMKEVNASEVTREIRDVFTNHPVSRGMALLFPDPVPDVSFSTDLSLILRVLVNMVTNAFEATEPGGEIRLGIEPQDGWVSFSVWNPAPIPDSVALRVFERHFSTKSESGRGIGTYAMKLIGEEILGGKVDFSTSEKEGTTFRFSLPV